MLPLTSTRAQTPAARPRNATWKRSNHVATASATAPKRTQTIGTRNKSSRPLNGYTPAHDATTVLSTAMTAMVASGEERRASNRKPPMVRPNAAQLHEIASCVLIISDHAERYQLGCAQGAGPKYLAQ